MVKGKQSIREKKEQRGNGEMVMVEMFAVVLFLSVSVFSEAVAQGDVPVVCGGLIKSSFHVDFTRIKVSYPYVLVVLCRARTG